jgi:hypothetical protein
MNSVQLAHPRILCQRLIAIVSHVPWTTKFVRIVINPGGKGSRLPEISRKMISQRIKAGSMKKDLYYHLASKDPELCPTFAYIPLSEQ